MFCGVEGEVVVDTMGQLHGVCAASHRLFLAGVLEVDQRELWRLDGARSIESWLDLRFGMAHTTARESVRVARAFVFTPELAARYEAGVLSWDQLVCCVDLVAFGGLADAEVAADGVGRSAAELDRLARDARRVSRDEADERHRKRYLRMRWDRDGTLRLNGRLSDADGKIVEKALTRAADEQPADPDGLVARRPVDQRQADALAEICSAAIARDADPDRATVVIHADASMLLGPAAWAAEQRAKRAEGAAVVELGPTISEATAVRLCCDGRVQLVIEDGDGNVVHAAKTIHAVPPWLRRTVLRRDHGCRWPGCDRQRFLHIHHITWWTHGGLTQHDNLTALCTYHHRLVHEGGWALTGNPTAHLTITSPTGRVLTCGPPGLRPDIRDELGLHSATDPPGTAA